MGDMPESLMTCVTVRGLVSGDVPESVDPELAGEFESWPGESSDPLFTLGLLPALWDELGLEDWLGPVGLAG